MSQWTFSRWGLCLSVFFPVGLCLGFFQGDYVWVFFFQWCCLSSNWDTQQIPLLMFLYVFRCLPTAQNTPPNSHCESGHNDKTRLPAVFYEQRKHPRATTSHLRSSCLLSFCPLCRISSATTVSVTHSPVES